MKPEKTSRGDSTITGLCGFDWKTEGSGWVYDSGLSVDDDLGGMDIEKFRKQYWTIRPDFRFWTEDRKKQLIVEGKW